MYNKNYVVSSGGLSWKACFFVKSSLQLIGAPYNPSERKIKFPWKTTMMMMVEDPLLVRESQHHNCDNNVVQEQYFLWKQTYQIIPN